MIGWKMKACARCEGDMFIDRDIDGWFQQCLQCSYRRELKELEVPGRQLVTAGRRHVGWDDEDDDIFGS